MRSLGLARSAVVHIGRQRGVILLAFFIVLFLAAAGAIITVLDNNTVSQRRNDNTANAMREAKEAVIAYAVLYSEYYSVAGSGPGYLPCPDTNGNGLENAPCGINSLGRLPTLITLPSGSNFPLSDYRSDVDEQFWYSVSDTFRRSALGILNTTAISTTTLDAQNRIAAIIIAPGPATGGQARPSNAVANYLEDSNTTAPSFVSSDPLSPALFNDRVLPVTIDEIMTPITRKIADLVQVQLDAYHLASGTGYPLSQVEFDAMLLAAPLPAWFNANGWDNVGPLLINYTRVTNNEATLAFTGCANVSYQLFYSVADSPTNIRRVGSQC